VTLRIERAGATLEKTLTPAAQGKFEIGTIGIVPILNPQVAAVVPGEAADAAGLKVGDVIIEAAGERNAKYERVLELIKAHGGKPLALRIRRGSEILPVEVTPRPEGDIGKVGASIRSAEYRYADPGPLEAVKLSAIQNWEWTKLIGKTLKGLFTRDTPMNQLVGPIGIAELSGGAARAGWLELFGFMAMISLNLGLINLMPIPVLDGGHILILALEGVSRRDFSMKVKEKMLLVGFVLLLTLMVTVIYNDLARVEWIQKLMVWRS
jgi:regulator of sigma E protease